MEKIAVLTVYYGELPLYYRLWLRSCELNPTIDFYMVTDIKITALPKNVKVIPISFQEFRALAEKKLGLPISLDTPYKLCDYKPLYGQIMEDYLTEYDYWAHCDMDLIFGDLRAYFDKFNLSKFDRFLHLGHLSLYRNTAECSKFYTLPGSKCGSWKDVVTNPENYLFDEWNGIYGIFHENNLPMFEERIFADISIIYTRFRLALDDPNYDQQVFYWEDGHVYRTYWLDGEEKTEEFIYIHFKKRKFGKEPFDAASIKAFFIGPDGFTEKTGLVRREDVDRFNPYQGVEYEKRELKHRRQMEERQKWKDRFNRIWGKIKQ